MHMEGVKMPDIVLECNNIRKKVGNHVIINDISFQLKEGDILGFIGLNGAGKTTTIKLLLGLQELNGGSVKIGGYDLKKNFVSAISNVGAIVENPDLYMYLSGYENLKISSLIYHLKEERIHEVVKLVGLEDRIYDKVKKYSLGMRQRLGIAQAILHNPRVLILDEPMNGLDPEGIKDLKKLLLYLAKEQKIAILISSHVLSELESICNRVCIISKGKIMKDATIEEIHQVTDQISYRMEVSSVDLDKILYHYEIIDEQHIRVYGTKEHMNNILKTLLLNKISIYEMKKEILSLEDVFLKLTKEESNGQSH